MRVSVVALALLCIAGVSGGRVRQAIFGRIFGQGKPEVPHPDTDADQAELIDFLKHHGFAKYAGNEFIQKLDDVLAYDSIEDMTHLVADDDYTEIGIQHDEALDIQKAARREMLKRFLASVPLPANEAHGFWLPYLDPLIAAGYDEPEDVADLEDVDAQMIGIEMDHVKILITWAEEFDARELLHIILTTLVGPKGEMPYVAEAVHRPIINAFVKAGVRNLGDVSTLTTNEVPSISKEDLQRIQNDHRVQQHANKQEL